MNYNPDFLNYRAILTEEEKEKLFLLNKKINFKTFMSQKNIEELGIDFVYSSAMLEGNSYTLHDTLTLLKLGQTAGGKNFNDAVMILNLRKSYELLIANLKNSFSNINEYKDFIKENHFEISKDLVPKGKRGAIRNETIKISGTEYKPLSSSKMLDTELNYLLNISGKYDNPFEKAIYLHNNLAYLQYFVDCNKRTARNISSFELLRNEIFPCLYSKGSGQEYISNLLKYYETGDYSDFKNYFISTFEKSIQDNLTMELDSAIVQKIEKRNTDEIKNNHSTVFSASIKRKF